MALLWGVASTATEADERALLLLEQKIPLGKVSGRIDHLAIDPERHRLFVAELANNSLGVVDLDAGRLVRNLSGVKRPQGVSYVKSTDTLYVANASDGSLQLFQGRDLVPAGRIELGDDADNIRVDQSDGKLFVGYGQGALATSIRKSPIFSCRRIQKASSSPPRASRFSSTCRKFGRSRQSTPTTAK